jgi:hypothetical protein
MWDLLIVTKWDLLIVFCQFCPYFRCAVGLVPCFGAGMRILPPLCGFRFVRRSTVRNDGEPGYMLIFV